MKLAKVLALLSIGALVTIGINAAVAGPNGGSATGKRVTQVKTKYGEVLAGTLLPWADVTTMSMTVPAGTKAIIDVRFDAYGDCYGDAATAGSCQLRVLVAGKVAKPVTGGYVAEQGPSNGNSVEGQWMIERSTPILGPGTYKIRIQHGAIGDPSTYFAVYSWHAIAERIAA